GISTVVAASLLALASWASRSPTARWPEIAAAPALAGSSALAIHVESGLETPLVTLAITLGWATTRHALREHRPPRFGLACFVVAALVRFDAFVPLGLALASTRMAGSTNLRRFLRPAIVPVLVYPTYF